jgi:hypothetical protein
VRNKNTTQSQLSKLAAFRQSVYGCLIKARDALFELVDAVLTMPQLTSFPELSCAPVFRRQWPSLYEALQDGAIDRKELLKIQVEYLPPVDRPLLVGDHTAWSRPQARTLKDRTFEHQPTPITGQKPITIGHGYSTLGVVPEKESSWLLPLLHERINSEITPSAKMAVQLKEVCPLLMKVSLQRPFGLFDSEYGSGTFLKATDGIDCDLLFRVRPNRKLRLAPGPYKGRGRRPEHGPVFRLGDPTTWPEPDEEWEVEDEKLGPMKIKRWDSLHFEDAPKRNVMLLRVERLKARKTRRDPGVIWLGYCGQDKPPLKSPMWREYLSRYVIEHWYRFINQSLHWKLPHLSTPEQSELWSTLMVIASWQIWLARRAAEDSPRPWQKPQSPEKMTPGRVHQAMGGVLAGIGTPAKAPKPRGNSPGWPLGRVRTKRTRYAVIKKKSEQTEKDSKAASTTSQVPT